MYSTQRDDNKNPLDLNGLKVQEDFYNLKLASLIRFLFKYNIDNDSIKIFF